jgi:predicted nucleic acid-binding protein
VADDAVIETSTLINFLRIGRVDLLAGLAAYRFIMPDNVQAEVSTNYPVESANLDLALRAGQLQVVSLTDTAELAVYVAMQSLGGLGDGECAAVAAAYVRGLPLAMDDGPARKKTAAHYPTVTLLDTVGLVVEAIRAGLLTVAEADVIKADWHANHNFKKPKLKSFGDFFP